ncbi:MAG: hypothetical protein HPZ91_13835 [Lentisphaeria bacterium]|nr:hypothetical protein [Lentisphaeria bacterium]
MNSPVMVLANLLIVMMVFLVMPVWIIVRVKLPRWSKLMLGFNYFALLVIITMHIGATGSLFRANRAAKENMEVLIRELRSRPAAEIVPVLDDCLAHDEESYFLLSEKFPGAEGEAKKPAAKLPELAVPQCPVKSVNGLPGCGPS